MYKRQGVKSKSIRASTVVNVMAVVVVTGNSKDCYCNNSYLKKRKTTSVIVYLTDFSRAEIKNTNIELYDYGDRSTIA